MSCAYVKTGFEHLERVMVINAPVVSCCGRAADQCTCDGHKKEHTENDGERGDTTDVENYFEPSGLTPVNGGLPVPYWDAFFAPNEQKKPERQKKSNESQPLPLLMESVHNLGRDGITPMPKLDWQAMFERDLEAEQAKQKASATGKKDMVLNRRPAEASMSDAYQPWKF